MNHAIAFHAAKVKSLWNKACKFDGIPPDSKFVVFSDLNPHADAYNRAMFDLQVVRQQARMLQTSIPVR